MKVGGSGYFKTKIEIVKPIINQQKTLLASTTATITNKTTEKPTDNNVIHLAQNYPQVQPPYGLNNMTSNIGDNPRLLSLFTILTFPNDACMSGSGGNGTCYRYIHTIHIIHIINKNSCKMTDK